jgi:hypothetical protein
MRRPSGLANTQCSASLFEARLLETDFGGSRVGPSADPNWRQRITAPCKPRRAFLALRKRIGSQPRVCALEAPRKGGDPKCRTTLKFPKSCGRSFAKLNASVRQKRKTRQGASFLVAPRSLNILQRADKESAVAVKAEARPPSEPGLCAYQTRARWQSASCSAALKREHCDVPFSRTQEVEEVDASILASLGYAQERKVFVNALLRRRS